MDASGATRASASCPKDTLACSLKSTGARDQSAFFLIGRQAARPAESQVLCDVKGQCAQLLTNLCRNFRTKTNYMDLEVYEKIPN